MDELEIYDKNLPRFRITFVDRIGLYVDAVLEDVFGRVHTDYMRGYLKSCANYSYKKFARFINLKQVIEIRLVRAKNKNLLLINFHFTNNKNKH